MTTPFPKVLGHEYARVGLWRSFVEGRLHHATLLHGLRGVGKRTLAESVARSLVCDAPAGGPCETCSHCRRTAQNLHPDVVIIDRDDILGIDEGMMANRDERRRKRKERVGKQIDTEYMRCLGEWLGQKPWEAKRRAAVVVDAERMHPAGANAFLKSLEEPAAGATVILTSSSPSFLLSTIRSRCAAIRLSGVPQALIERRLVDHGIDPAEAHFRALACAGSLARALEPRPPLDDLRDQILLRFAGGREAGMAAFEAASIAGGKESDRDEALHLFATLLRDIEVVRMGGGYDVLLHPQASEAIAVAAAGSIDTFALFARVIEARVRVAGNANKTLLWDDLLHDAGAGESR